MVVIVITGQYEKGTVTKSVLCVKWIINIFPTSCSCLSGSCVMHSPCMFSFTDSAVPAFPSLQGWTLTYFEVCPVGQVSVIFTCPK